eukprot:g31400.t1
MIFSILFVCFAPLEQVMGQPQSTKNKNLFTAINQGNAKKVKVLIEDKGAQVNARNHEDLTPLIVAVMRNSPKVIKYLLDVKADVNAKDPHGQTALHHAGHDQVKAKITQYLLAAGAKITIEDEYRITPLHVAAKYGNTEVAKLIMEAHKGNNQNGRLPREHLQSARELAAKRGNQGIADLIPEQDLGRASAPSKDVTQQEVDNHALFDK